MAQTLRISLKLFILRDGFYIFNPKEVMSATRLLSSVAHHTERFIVSSLLFFFLKQGGLLLQLPTSKQTPLTTHRPREYLKLASRQGRTGTGPDGVRSHFYVSARHWCQFATSCWHLSVLPIKGSGMLTKPEMPGLRPGRHPAQPSALTLALSSEQK